MSNHPFQTNRPAWAPVGLTLPGAALASVLFAAAAFQGLAAEPPALAPQPNPETASAEDTGLVPALSSSSPAASSGPSLSVTVNLIKQLVELGVLPKEKAANLLQQAENEAAEARSQLLAERDSAIQAAVSRTLASLQADPATALEPLPPPETSSRVTYVPEVVRSQIRDEIKRDLQSTARTEHWGAGPKPPEWIERIKLTADLRVRAEAISFGAGNDNTGAFPNFNAINTGEPFDYTPGIFSPQLNVDQDRQRIRLRARFGIESQLGEGFTAGMRVATGNTNTPVSVNQDMGLAAGGQGGNFSKYQVWLDRAFVKWDTGTPADRGLSASAGRFDNPFFATETIYDADLGFDGFALQGRYKVHDRFTPFFNAGLFPFFNTELHFATNQPRKFPSEDKWLYGAQVGSEVRLASKVQLKLGAAYYDFNNVEGRLSDPFVPLSARDVGNTDGTRPAFAQKGNTYRPLRNITPTEENGFGTSKQYQYYGLASPFRNLALTGRLDLNHWEPFQVSILGEYIKNLAFDGSAINAVAVNNRGAEGSSGRLGAFAGGDNAWMISARVGKPVFEKRGDYAASIGYRYVESDAVVDGFNDSNSGMGGTNLRGFSLWAGVAVSQRVNMGVRWTSSDEIAGPPLSVDIFLLDLNATF